MYYFVVWIVSLHVDVITPCRSKPTTRDMIYIFHVYYFNWTRLFMIILNIRMLSFYFINPYWLMIYFTFFPANIATCHTNFLCSSQLPALVYCKLCKPKFYIKRNMIYTYEIYIYQFNLHYNILGMPFSLALNCSFVEQNAALFLQVTNCPTND